MERVTIDGDGLALEQVLAVARDGARVDLAEAARARVEGSRRAVETLLQRGEVAYGITTGFGHFADRIISSEQSAALQRNILLSHAVGVGPPLDEVAVRATTLIRANTLAKGYSGVRWRTLTALVELLNRRVHPVIPAKGSLGASGDLAPLAHMALVLIGEGEAFYGGERLSGAEALRRAGLVALELEAKEGLALTNGTALMTALGTLLVGAAENTMRAADIAGALSLEALGGTPEPFDPRLHEVRPHPRLIECAAYLRRLLRGSQLVRTQARRRVQDAYSLRCIPQVHGAVRDVVAYLRWVAEIELNSATDNPLVFWEGDRPQVLSGGNFHGEPLALALDFLALGLTALGNISERRLARLLDEALNEGLLPPFLTREGGLNSGFMMVQYTSAALASENKVLSHPASADNIPTSANTEDHQSMGPTAALKARQVLANVETMIAIELLAVAQAIDFRREGKTLRLGQGTDPAYQAVREQVPFLERDAALYPYIEAVRQLVAGGDLVQRVERALIAEA
ncbi:MAG: histidine ammonia-lyase [Chloroflexi bacterium]|nr:histidine ammonia-lyase [Chloroflexota bacterium]